MDPYPSSHKFPILRIGSGQLCDLLETIAALWPELRAAIDEAIQLQNQETAGVNDSAAVEPQAKSQPNAGRGGRRLLTNDARFPRTPFSSGVVGR